MKGLIAGIIAGIAGAALWAGIAAVTGFEIGWLAWGIGAAVGAAVAWGSEGSPVTGGLAVVIAILAIVTGKYITVEIVLAKEMGTANEEIARQMETEEYLISWLADGMVYNLTEAGQTINWPAGVNPDEASAKEDYPPALWAAAEQTWSSTSEEERAEFKTEVQAQVDANVQAFASSIKKDGFLASFGAFDVIFFVLAIATAYKVGSKADQPA